MGGGNLRVLDKKLLESYDKVNDSKSLHDWWRRKYFCLVHNTEVCRARVAHRSLRLLGLGQQLMVIDWDVSLATNYPCTRFLRLIFTDSTVRGKERRKTMEIVQLTNIKWTFSDSKFRHVETESNGKQMKNCTNVIDWFKMMLRLGNHNLLKYKPRAQSTLFVALSQW
jgi:hypothetical protein